MPIVFFNKEPSRKALDSYDKAYYVGTDSKESGIIQGDLIAKHWAANPELGPEQRRSDSVRAAERRTATRMLKRVPPTLSKS